MSQIGKNTNFGPFAVWYLPFTHCQKSLSYFSPVQKKRRICAYTDNSEKLLSGPLPIRFSSVHCQKSVIYSYFSYKNASTWAVWTAKNQLYYSQKCLKNIALQLSVLNQEKTPPLAHCRAVFFPFTNCQKSYSILSFKISNTLCPNNWVLTLSQSLGKNLP